MLELFNHWNLYCLQGRTNKLVDGCYSFWQGGIFPLMHRLLQEEGEKKECNFGDYFDGVGLKGFFLRLWL